MILKKLRKNRRAAELALNVVVIAALAMLVLVVVGVIFLRGASRSDPSLTCVSQQGVCRETCDSASEEEVSKPGVFLCADNDNDGRADLRCCKNTAFTR